mgnify:CR=1 FL=1
MKLLFFALLIFCMSAPEFSVAANPPPAAAKSKRKAVPNRVTTVKRPMKPMAGFVPRVEASIHYGCADAQEVQAAAHRLTDADAMGALFKVMAWVHPDWADPAGFEK